MEIFDNLAEISSKADVFQYYTAADLWTDEHTSTQMLAYHLNESIDLSSRNIQFIKCSVSWIISHFNLDKNSSLIDFGCGPGLYTGLLAKNGINVTGVDFSSRSIQFAKEQAARNSLQIKYVNEDYLNFQSEDRFDLIIIIMCDYCALSPQQRKLMLKKFADLLKPRGSLLFDVYSLNAFEQRQESSSFGKNIMDGFWSANEYYCFLHQFNFEEDKVTLDKYTIIEKSRTRTVYNWLQYFSQESLQDELESNGFRLREIYMDVAGRKFSPESSEFAAVAGLT